MEAGITLLDMFARLGVAAGLALVLGLERELRGKPAGLRSHMLVALGAAAFLIVASRSCTPPPRATPPPASIRPASSRA
ncbi:MgtC/SapB family protein [Halomonas sp. B23F22_10]|uniref:MgtC/SapB family protein n=1 Tax=Halomonas sp. B23F22_10 TaxID=3459515 RepID=UPI00373E9580